MVFWEFLSIFGSFIFWIIVTVLSVIVFLFSSKRIKKKMLWFISTVLPSVILSRFITEIIKMIFKISRPCIGPECPITYSFPSGHATVIFAAVTVISLNYKNWRITTLMTVFAVLVALSRLMLGLHRLEDIFVGSIIGIIVAVLVRRTYENYQRKIKEII